jgi:hypothetical protein
MKHLQAALEQPVKGDLCVVSEIVPIPTAKISIMRFPEKICVRLHRVSGLSEMFRHYPKKPVEGRAPSNQNDLVLVGFNIIFSR